NWGPDDLLRLIAASSYPRLLLSAYDISSLTGPRALEVSRRLAKYRKEGGSVLLDSGLFESIWKDDGGWTFGRYAEVVKKFTIDFFCSYDGPAKRRLRKALRWTQQPAGHNVSANLRTDA